MELKIQTFNSKNPYESERHYEYYSFQICTHRFQSVNKQNKKEEKENYPYF